VLFVFGGLSLPVCLSVCPRGELDQDWKARAAAAICFALVAVWHCWAGRAHSLSALACLGRPSGPPGGAWHTSGGEVARALSHTTHSHPRSPSLCAHLIPFPPDLHTALSTLHYFTMDCVRALCLSPALPPPASPALPCFPHFHPLARPTGRPTDELSRRGRHMCSCCRSSARRPSVCPSVCLGSICGTCACLPACLFVPRWHSTPAPSHTLSAQPTSFTPTVSASRQRPSSPRQSPGSIRDTSQPFRAHPWRQMGARSTKGRHSTLWPARHSPKGRPMVALLANHEWRPPQDARRCRRARSVARECL